MLTTVAWILALVGTTAALRLWRRQREQLARRQAMDAEHARFLAAAESSLNAFAIVDAVRDAAGSLVAFRFSYVNSNAERLAGQSRQQIIGQPLEAVLRPGSAATLGIILRRVVETGEPLRGEQRFSPEQENQTWLVPRETPPGSNASVWIRYHAVRLGDGVAITCSNITAAKEVEVQHRQLAEFNRSIFENAPFSMIALDREGVITAVNLAAEKLTGYLREEMVGQMVITALHDEKELRERALKGRSMRLLEADGVELLTARAAGGEMDEMELTYLRKDGTRIPVNLAMRAVTTASGSVSGFVVVAFDITERRRMLDHITYMATHDALTGLVVRSVLQEHTAEAVERSRRWGTKVAAFLIDLDQLKRINDQLGHQKGDRVIAEIAHRLQRGVRSSDIVGRLGGDKFAVVMTDITNARDVEQCAQHLVQCMAPAITVDEHEIYITGSIGVCTYPDYATDAVHLLRRASLAMNAAKENGRNQFMVFNESMLRETADRLSLEHALRHALPNGELSLAYQPQVSLSSGAVIGMEALLRWHHPKFGQVPPSQFIPLAEEAGIILPIGEWVFQRACMEGMEMRRQVGTDLIISVNLSPRQFQQSNLVQVIAAALQTSGLPAASLEIEITESILMVNSESNRDTLQRIRDLGVRIAIDDFGTGFSSFSYLLQYRVDRLKIDASFIHKSVDDTNAATIVRTIIAMSHSLNIAVIAEGVENEEQLRFLLRRRCDEAQGRYFSGPVSALEFEASVLNLNDQPISLSH